MTGNEGSISTPLRGNNHAPASSAPLDSPLHQTGNMTTGSKSTATGSIKPALTGRRSLLSLRQSFGSTSQAPSTPRRGSITPTNVPALPTPSAASRLAGKRGKPLEIGDEVIMDGTSLIGVLRHLGPVTFKPGEYAGMELIGSSAGKGKNDGSVQGVQYFACEAGDGIFCPAHKVSLVSMQVPTEATARPQSALSSRSGRSSVAGGEYRPPSTTPSARSRSSTVSNAPRPSSTTPGRAPSRSALNRPGSSLAGRSSIGNGSNNGNRTGQRLVIRKSIADGVADEEGRRRAKTSAEEAERAEGKITAGSRAHRFLNMNAKDLESNGTAAAASDLFGSAVAVKGSSPIKAGRPSSPLKETLLGGTRAQVGLATPKGRSSVGATGLPTPRVGKSKLAALGQKSGSGMLPPSGPQSWNENDRGTAVGARETKGGWGDAPHTPGRPSLSAEERGEEEEGRDDPSATPSTTLRKAKNQMLLEEMDLTPKRHSGTLTSAEGQSDPRVYDDDNVGSAVGGYAFTTNGDGDEAGLAVVPLALYEESTLELARLKAQLSETAKKLQQSQANGRADLERAKVRAQEEAQRESEEEKKVEREDEARRRRELEGREREAREKGETLAKEVRKLKEEVKRAEGEREEKMREVGAQLRESEALVEKLKDALDSGGATSKEVEGRLKGKDLELEQLNERIKRVVEEKDKAREEHLREVDDLKAAGEEAFDIFQKEQALSNEIVEETENKMRMLEARAQEAIIEVERQRDEALRQFKPSSAAEIDHQSLQEQLSQAQKRIISLEDQLAESNMAMQQEREANVKRKDRFGEIEAKLKGEANRAKEEYRHVSKSEAEARSRIEELMEALEEGRAALESERAELEILRTEALVIGVGQHNQPLNEREKNKYEGEVERLTGLLEGARSGKREASRLVEEKAKEIAELHSLVDEVQTHLKMVTADKQAVEARLDRPSLTEDPSGIIGHLQNTIEIKKKEVESLQRVNLPLSEQVVSLIDGHRKEMVTKEEEVQALRRKLDSSLKRGSGSQYSLTVPSSNGPGSETNSQSPVLGGTEVSPRNSKRFSSMSNQSRKSRTSLGHLINSPDNTFKEMAGLRSIVNTLNQELTESKVNSMQQERELKSQVESWREEARKWQLTAERGKQGGGGAETSEAIQNQLQVEKKLYESQQQVQRYKGKLEALELKKREEVDKLNQDINELETLCEATVWRREEQDAKREELERLVEKLQRKLNRGLNAEGESGQERSSLESTSTSLHKDEVVCDDCGERGHRMGDDCPYNRDDMLF